MKNIICIPDDLKFSSLRLSRDPGTGAIGFDWAPIERICEASNIDIAVFRDAHEDNVAGLIAAWYFEHLRQGGAPDPVREEIIAETKAEDKQGGGFSHEPGQA